MTFRILTRVRTSLTVAVCLAPLFVTSAALAEEDYPGPFSEAAGYDCPVQCLVCHTDAAGGADKLNPFGFNAFLNGILPGQPGTVRLAVANMRMKPDLDSDMDGVKDFQEFENHTDPSKQNTPITCIGYGCGARIAKPAPPSSSSSAPYVIGALSVLGFLGGRAAQRRRSRAAR